jgi:orotidine-5'-phosphate decarboxylase
VLKAKTISASERLIVALDVSTSDEARRIVASLRGVTSFYKVGYQLFVTEGMAYVRELLDSGYRVFLDLKMDDIGETITSAVREIARNEVHLLTLQGIGAAARAAVAGRGGASFPKILSVTLLSSMSERDLADLHLVGPDKRFPGLLDFVLWRAEEAIGAGCDGVIASGESIGEVRKRLGPDPLIVSPGIRPSAHDTNDHKRPTTPGAAILAGADYLVVGRPIRQAADPRAVALAVIAEIDRAAATVATAAQH